jgi:hypothetical protein
VIASARNQCRSGRERNGPSGRTKKPMRALTDEQFAAMRDPKLAATTNLPRIEDAVEAGGFLTGTPTDIIELLKAVEKRYPGLDRVVCSMALGTGSPWHWNSWTGSRRK